MMPSEIAATKTTTGTCLASAASRKARSTPPSASFPAASEAAANGGPYFAHEAATETAAADFSTARRVCLLDVMDLSSQKYQAVLRRISKTGSHSAEPIDLGQLGQPNLGS